jgi:hypothetical protein
VHVLEILGGFDAYLLCLVEWELEAADIVPIEDRQVNMGAIELFAPRKLEGNKTPGGELGALEFWEFAAERRGDECRELPIEST